MNWFRDQMKQGMNPRTYVLLAILIGVLVWIRSLDVKQRALRARSAAAPAQAPAPAVAVRAVAAGFHGPEATPPGWGSDPFEKRVADAGESPGTARPSPSRATKPKSTGLYLQGIMRGPLGRTALINGEIYREGQRIGAREVIQIGSRSVMILDHGNVTTLTLKGDGS